MTESNANPLSLSSMMSLEAIIAMNADVAADAAQAQEQPYVPADVDEASEWPPFPFPSIGPHIPAGWERTTDEFFVDSSGFGKDYEVALTAEQFKQQLLEYISEYPSYGYAITEEGPFQLIVSTFRPRIAESLANSSEQV